MPPTRACIFLDTTVLIHGLPIEQPDWAKHFALDEVVLVLSSTVISELDKLKDGAEGRFSRDRARDFFARFQKYEATVLDAPGALVRERVWLRVLTNEPKLFDGADPMVPDDRIISAILGFETEPGTTRMLLARDTTILLKARARELRAERLPEEWEVQPELDPVEKELRATRKELADLKHRQPKISLLLAHGEQRHDQYIDTVVVDVRLPEDQEVERQYSYEEENCRSRKNWGGLFAFMQPSESQVKGHLSRFREYLEKVTPVERKLGRRVRVGFVLSNEGAALASKIEIDVTAGNGIRFGYVDERPKIPRRPKLRSVYENIAAFSQHQAPFGVALAMPRGLRHIYVAPEQVEYALKDVMHSDRRVLDEFDVVLPEGWQEKGFPLDVTLRVAELPRPERLTFNIRTLIEQREPFSRVEDDEES